MKKFWRSSSRYRIILIFALLGLAFLLVPIQRYVTIDRPQHHAASFCIFAIGCLLQTAFSWRHLSKWGRASYLSTSSYFLALALTLFFNPWLDTTVSIQPSGDEPFMDRHVLVAFSVLFIFVQVVLWSKWVREEIAIAELQETKEGT
jgi:hypothetical protein